MSFIEVDHLSHSYHIEKDIEYKALQDINLSIEAGQFVAVIGTNGSGKSTLAKHLNALLLPTQGCCKINGLDTKEQADLWKIRREVGMVFQNPDNQIIAAVVEEDVAFGPENIGVPPEEIRLRVTEALQAVGMSKFRKFAPHLLSGGQKQRIAIAGALAMRTHCLVLDEPTAMLDPTGRKEVLQTVQKLHKELGMTILYITHFMEEAIAADRVIVMENGKIAVDGIPADIFTQVDKLEKMGLEVPLAVKMAEELRKKGIRIPKTVMTDEELAVALCQ